MTMARRGFHNMLLTLLAMLLLLCYNRSWSMGYHDTKKNGFVMRRAATATETDIAHDHHPPWSKSKEWKMVDENFNWNMRQTGVRSDWTCGLGCWSHYDPDSLERASMATPVSLSSGIMCKFLRNINATAFELCNLHEPKAIGSFAKYLGEPREADGLYQNRHTFVRTPYRVTTLAPPSQTPPRLAATAEDTTNDDVDKILMRIRDADKSRATIVQPKGATFAGPRFVPTVRQARALVQKQERNADNDNGSIANVPKLKTCEMWLSEPYQNIAEARKTGLFCVYDGIQGGLQKIVHIKEATLRDDQIPTQGGPPRHNKNTDSESDDSSDGMDIQEQLPLEIRELESQLIKEDYVPWTKETTKSDFFQSEGEVASGATSTTNSQNLKPISSIVNGEDGKCLPIWESFYGRAVWTHDGHAGPESECTVNISLMPPPTAAPSSLEEEQKKDCAVDPNDNSGNVLLPPYYSPIEDTNSEGAYYENRFPNGSYWRIPKSFHPDVLNKSGDENNDITDGDDHAPICMEFGSLTLDGDFHRLIALGSRAEGGFQTIVYEKWTAKR